MIALATIVLAIASAAAIAPVARRPGWSKPIILAPPYLCGFLPAPCEKTTPDFAARRLGYIGRVVREKSSNPVDVCAESAAKHGAALSAPRAIQKANCRRPLKRKDLQVDSAFRFRLSFQHDLSFIPVSAFPDHALAGAPQRGVYHKRRTKRVGAGNCGRSAICTAIKRLCHIMLPHFHGENAPARGGKASPSSTCPCELKPPATPSRGHLFCQARIY